MGIIPKKVVQAFIDKPRKDYRTYKKLTREALERMKNALEVDPPIWYKLTHLQRVCFIIGATTKRFAFLNDMGTGKTLLAIALVRFFRRLGIVRQVLILVPNRINKTEWVEQLQFHSPTSSYLVLQESSIEKWRLLRESKALFVIETYAGLMRMVCDKVEVQKKGQKKGKLVPNKKLLKELSERFQGLILDESVVAKNHTKLPYRICRALAKTVKTMFILTGTPFNRDPSELWAQMYLVDFGETLGETLGLFRAAFFKEKPNFFGGMDYTFDKKMEPILNRILANRSISYPANEADLPRVFPIPLYVSLPGDAQAYYDRIKADLIASRGNFQETKNAFLRMRQISSGFIGYDDDETGERAKFIFPDNPKLDLLLSKLQEVKPGEKSIVFFDFTYSGESIADELSKLKMNPLLLYGKTKHQDKVRDSFKYKANHNILLLQGLFGQGLNIQVARYGMFYESPVSAIMRKQCERRVERQHSQYDTVFMLDFLMRGTVDEQIRAFHKQGGDLMQALLRQEVTL
jgi:SNF2 family DNA or RNA helicase